MNTFLKSILGVVIITLAVYVNSTTERRAPGSDSSEALILDILRVDRPSTRPAEQMLRFLFMDSSKSVSQESLEESVSSSRAWGDDPAQPAGEPVSAVRLQTLEAALIERLLATNAPEERDRIADLIRAIRKYRTQNGTAPKIFATIDSRQASSIFYGTDTAAHISTDGRLNEATTAETGDSNANSSPVALLDATPGDSFRRRVTQTAAITIDDIRNRPYIFLIPLVVALLYFSLIVAGIYTGAIYEALGRMDSARSVSLRQIVRHASSAGAWQGLFASPMVFVIVMVLVPKNTVSMPMALFAFQNGFFWRATLQKFGEVKGAINSRNTHSANA